MEGRVTRSRAKALGTPLAAMPPQLPEPRTTGRRRKAAVQQADNQETSKKLEFTDEASSDIPDKASDLSNVPEDQPAEVTVDPTAIDAPAPSMCSPPAAIDAPASDVCSPPTMDDAPAPDVCGVPMTNDGPAPDVCSPSTANDDPAPDVCSPPTANHHPVLAESSVRDATHLDFIPSPTAIEASHIQESEAEPVSEASPCLQSPAHGVSDEADSLPYISPAPCVRSAVSPLPPSLPTNGSTDLALPMPIATIPATSSAGIEDLATPSPETSPPAASPAPSIMAMDASPLPMIGSPEFIPELVPSPDAVNDNAAPTPISFTSDAPNVVGGFAQPANVSIPATPLSFTDMLAHAEEMPGGDLELDGSPISLSGDAFHLTEPTPQQHQEMGFHEPMDTDMADSTPIGAYNLTSSPLTYVSDRLQIDVNPSPAVNLLGEPQSVPHNAAVPDSVLRSPAEITTFKGFAAGPTGLEVNSPSMDGVLPASAGGISPALFHTSMATTPGLYPTSADATYLELNVAGSVADASPLEDSILPPAPAPTPVEVMVNGSVPTLVADVCATFASESYLPVGDLDVEMDAEPVSDLPGDSSTSVADETPAPGHTVATTAAATAFTPTVSKTPSAVAGRTPLAGSASRAQTPKQITSKAAGAASTVTPVAPSTKTKASYISVPSRYLSPATSKQQNSATTAPATNTAAGSKPAKRVSINTPEGPRFAASHRPHVVPTPFRPKSGERAPTDLASSADVPMDAAGPSDERRAKAAERLKAIHATENTAASTLSGPGYLAPTMAFTVKTDKGAADKGVKSKVDAGNYDSRSLRQLKRDVAELKAKKAMSAPRETKLTPKVAERSLPMPEENSDEEADYDEGQENALVQAMTGLEVAQPTKAVAPLRGVPAPQGKHIRFGEDGKTTESPKRVVLRGLPVATGKYKRFE